MPTTRNQFVFFGTSRFSLIVLDELKHAGIVPELIVTAPDKPQGRNLVLTSPPVKTWAEQNNVPFLQPAKLDDAFIDKLQAISYKLFLVASYGKIIPQKILDLPEHGTLNVHPSLLPKYRGPSPIQSQVLADEKDIGVSIMLLDEKMDHGPIVARAQCIVDNTQKEGGWPPNAKELEELLARQGGALLAKTIPEWLAGSITPQEQEHDKATYTKKITKEDALLDLAGDPYKNFLKIRAYGPWPGTYFFVEKKGAKIRVLIKDATFENGVLTITRVIPEGKKEVSYEDFLRGTHDTGGNRIC